MENLSRTELEKKIGGLEMQIVELQEAALNGNEVNLGEISKLQDELDLLNEELDEMARNDGDIEPKSKDEINSTNNAEDKEDELDKQIQFEQEKIEKEEMERLSEEQENEKNKEELEKEIPNDNDMENEVSNEGGERKLTLLDWQKESGIELLPDDEIKQKYDKFLTREEFMSILDNENVPKLIRESGRAESFLKSDEDWRAVETSDSALREAVDNGNIPVEVDGEDYIKRQYSDSEIRDKDESSMEDGYGKIDAEDIEEELQGDEDEERTQKEIEDDIDESIEDVSDSELSKTSIALAYISKHPEMAVEDEKEKDDDEYEIASPKVIKFF